MMYKAKVAVCSEIHTKHSKQSEHHVEFLNFKPWWYGKKPLGFKRLMMSVKIVRCTHNFAIMYDRQCMYHSAN
jgi:hypothetical protein